MISDKVKKIRKQKGWSQQKLAQEAGLSLAVITKMEQGITADPAISSVVKLANALHVSLDELVRK